MEHVRRSGTGPVAKQRRRFGRDQNATQVLGDQTAGVQEVGQEGRRVRGGLGRGTRRQARAVQVHPGQLSPFAEDREQIRRENLQPGVRGEPDGSVFEKSREQGSDESRRNDAGPGKLHGAVGTRTTRATYAVDEAAPGNRNVLSAGGGGHARRRETHGDRADGLQGRVELDERRFAGAGPGRELAAGQVQKRADQGEKVETEVRPSQAGVLAEGRPAGRGALQHVLSRAHFLSTKPAAFRRDRGGVVRKRHQGFQTVPALRFQNDQGTANGRTTTRVQGGRRRRRRRQRPLEQQPVHGVGRRGDVRSRRRGDRRRGDRRAVVAVRRRRRVRQFPVPTAVRRLAGAARRTPPEDRGRVPAVAAVVGPAVRVRGAHARRPKIGGFVLVQLAGHLRRPRSAERSRIGFEKGTVGLTLRRRGLRHNTVPRCSVFVCFLFPFM